ncbi:P53/DNA damage-regulated protein [Wolffia australiana]
MDASMMNLQQTLALIEAEAEHLLLARHELVENDKARNANREALTALRRRARTTKSSVESSPFDAMMKDLGARSRTLVKEICPTCGTYEPAEPTWMIFPGSDIFCSVPFHAAHVMLEEDQSRLDYSTKKLQSFVKEKSLVISEMGALDGSVNAGVLRSLVTLTDRRTKEHV